MRYLDVQNVKDLALGATVLGTGGGGDPYIGMLMAVHAIETHGPVQLISLDELDDDVLVAPSAMMGAPTVMVEKMPRGTEIVNAFQSLSSFLGKPIGATMSIEAGGLNSTIPITVAASLGIPMVDCDGMGRAFPEIPMVTHTLHGISATPFAMADERGNSVILETIDNHWTERFARSVTVDMGATALIACYATLGAQLKEAAIAGTITLAETIGRTIREARAEHADVLAAIQDVTGGFEIFRGKITDVERRTVQGFARGKAMFDGIEAYQGKKMTLHFQNENLMAMQDKEPLVSVPDLITVLDLETGQPITTEALRYGFRVAVLGIPCSSKWRTPEGLALVGPRYFGYDVDYVPVEQRFGFPG